MAGAKDRDDGHTHAMLYDGASMSQLSKLFGMDMRDISKKMNNVPPCGERRGFPIWKVKDAARVLVKPEISDHDIIDHISGMNFKELPAALNKEVWNGLRARLKFEQEQGVLWPTDRVLKAFNAFMQIVRMNYLLLPDRVDRADPLTPKQREAIVTIADDSLTDLKRELENIAGQMEELTPGFMDFTDEDEIDEQFEEPDDVQEAVEDFSDL